MTPIVWPEGKRFAFTVFDDTDAATVEKLRPVYDLLAGLGFRTTKTVWPLPPTQPPEVVGGTTCADPEYLAWAQSLQQQGFEIAWHNATCHSSTREQTLRGLDTFARLFGGPPRTMATHTTCREALYWGPDRLTGARRWLYLLLTGFRHAQRYRGHVPGDPYFWGDVCRDRLSYVRNFVFPGINTLAACPWMPYYDPDRPYVPAWFAASEGAHVDSFNALLHEAHQDRLEAEGGACIVYTHLAKGFAARGRVHPRFRELMERLSRKPGWFVPVAVLLDYLRQQRGLHPLTPAERSRLEWRWLRHKLRVGTT
jgi:hypothetical protein